MTFEALRAELTRRTTSDDRPGAGGAAHPLADLRRLAARLHGTSEVAGDTRFESRGVPSLETMTSQAADIGLEVTYAVRAVRSLEPADLPCVALLKDGTSRVILEILPRGRVRIEEAGVEHEVDRAALDALHSGTIFRVRRAPATAVEASGPATTEREASSATPAPHGPSSLAAMVLRQSVRQAPGLFAKLALAAALSNVLLLALPLFTMAVYDRVVPHFALETLWALAIGVCLALVLDIAIRFVRLKLVDAVALDTSLSLQARLYRTILKMRMADAPKTSGGLATNVRELDLVCQTVPPIFVAVLIDLPFFLAIVGLLALLGGWPIAGAPIVGIAVLAAASIAIRGFTSGSHVESAVLVRQQANQMIETVGALEWVKATNAEHRLLGRWERLSDAAAFASHRGRLWSGMSAQLGATVTQLVIVAVVVLGVYQIGAGAMTVGALTACTLLVGRAIAPLVQLIAYLDRLAHLAHVSEALEKLFAAPPEAGGDNALGARRPVRGRFDLTNVAFAYPGDSRPTLDEVTLSIGPGERVGIIGRVGSGKSTLLRLFLRLHEPTKGTMLLDGHDIRQVPPHWLRGAVGFMRQDPVLFDDTLLANLTFGLEHVPDRDIEEAARISGVKDIAARHPKGYSMPVGPRGERLSGGERQAIALARALVANPAVLILDEPTAAMDNGLEARVVRDLRQATAGKTVIVATHRAPVLQLCDRVIWLDGGRVIADGPRDEVLRKLSAA